MNFNIGDKVRIKNSVTQPFYGWGSMKGRNEIGEVTRVHLNGEYIINFPSHFDWNANGKELELAEAKAPQLFLIRGKDHQLRSFHKDAEELGYRLSDPKILDNLNLVGLWSNLMSTRTIDRESIERFKLIYGEGQGSYYPPNSENYKQFQLPGDYSTALSYLKECLESEYWQKATKNLHINNFEIEIGKGKISTKIQNRTYDLSVDALKSLCTCADEIAKIDSLPWALNIDTIKIGCKTFTISQLRQILEEYNKLNSSEV
jgi:hypothetical protein